MKIYLYANTKEKELIGESRANLDPLETKKQGKEVYLIPRNATTTKPPKAKDGFIILYSGTAWQSVENHKGEKGYINDELTEIKEYGALPSGFVPESEYQPKEPELTADELLAKKKTEFLSVVDKVLNETAQAHGYENILTACSYVREDSPFYTESQAFLKWRDEVYAWGYALLASIQKGERAMPDSVDEVLDDMPKFKA